MMERSPRALVLRSIAGNLLISPIFFENVVVFF